MIPLSHRSALPLAVLRTAGLALAAALALPVVVRADVAGLVAQVQEANLVAHVAALQGDRSTPAAQAAAAAYIRGELESYGYAVASQPVGASENLTATLVGLEAPDDEFVLGAHFDTVGGSPGADDDASGVAAVLEIARVLAAEPSHATVHFVAFALEESGYQGSEAYASALASQGREVIGMISLDMIGYTCNAPGCQAVLPEMPGCLVTSGLGDVGDFIGIGANTQSVPQLDAFLASAATWVPGLPLASFVVAGDGTCFSQSRRSDHRSFWDEGYPALVLGDGAEARNPNYHQASDTLATLDTAFLSSVTRAVLAHVATTAVEPAVVPLLGPAGTALLAAGLVWGAAAGRLPGRVEPRLRARRRRSPPRSRSGAGP